MPVDFILSKLLKQKGVSIMEDNTKHGKRLFTVQEASRETGVSEGCIRTWIQRGKLTVKRLGNKVYLDTAALAAIQGKKGM